MTCFYCKWFKELRKGSEDGICCRYPPQIEQYAVFGTTVYTTQRFPEVKTFLYCGEFKKKEEIL